MRLVRYQFQSRHSFLIFIGDEASSYLLANLREAVRSGIEEAGLLQKGKLDDAEVRDILHEAFIETGKQCQAA